MANKQSTSSPPEPALLTIEKGPAELKEIVLFIDGRTGSSPECSPKSTARA